MVENNRASISIRVDEESMAKIKAAAASEGRSVANWARYVLFQWVNERRRARGEEELDPSLIP